VPHRIPVVRRLLGKASVCHLAVDGPRGREERQAKGRSHYWQQWPDRSVGPTLPRSCHTRRPNDRLVRRSAETAAMLFWALLASGQITMRKVDGWQTLTEEPTIQCIDLAA
jgi:hypothetical protein